MNTVVVKPANVSHLALIRNLSWQTFFDTFHKDNSKEDMEQFLNESFNLETVRQELNDADNTFLIAYLKKEPVGYAKLSVKNVPEELKNENPIEISRIYAVKEKVGSGIGKMLMQECIETGRVAKKKVIWLGVWEFNQRAIQFYRKFGFEKFGEHPFILGKDKQTDWLMKRDIEPE